MGMGQLECWWTFRSLRTYRPQMEAAIHRSAQVLKYKPQVSPLVRGFVVLDLHGRVEHGRGLPQREVDAQRGQEGVVVVNLLTLEFPGHFGHLGIRSVPVKKKFYFLLAIRCKKILSLAEANRTWVRSQVRTFDDKETKKRAELTIEQPSKHFKITQSQFYKKNYQCRVAALWC